MASGGREYAASLSDQRQSGGGVFLQGEGEPRRDGSLRGTFGPGRGPAFQSFDGIHAGAPGAGGDASLCGERRGSATEYCSGKGGQLFIYPGSLGFDGAIGDETPDEGSPGRQPHDRNELRRRDQARKVRLQTERNHPKPALGGDAGPRCPNPARRRGISPENSRRRWQRRTGRPPCCRLERRRAC